MNFNKLIPELSVTNIEKSKKFYLDIGFEIKYERKENKFCFLELDGNQIMIEEINDHWNVAILERPFGRGINLSMTIENIEDFYKNVINQNIKIFKQLETHKYKVEDVTYEDKEFLIQDPDGYLLRFNS